jgi:hypothetical protein
MELLISALIIFILSLIISIFWVRGINYMQDNYPEYKGEDLFDENKKAK